MNDPMCGLTAGGGGCELDCDMNEFVLSVTETELRGDREIPGSGEP